MFEKMVSVQASILLDQRPEQREETSHMKTQGNPQRQKSNLWVRLTSSCIMPRFLRDLQSTYQIIITGDALIKI